MSYIIKQLIVLLKVNWTVLDHIKHEHLSNAHILSIIDEYNNQFILCIYIIHCSMQIEYIVLGRHKQLLYADRLTHCSIQIGLIVMCRE